MMKILQNLFKKSTNDAPVEPENNTFSICSDPTLNSLVIDCKNDQIAVERCVQGILQHMAYNNELRIEENHIILNILIEILDESTWKKSIDWDCGDYDPNNPYPWVNVLYTTSIYNDEELNSNLMTKKKLVLEEIKNGTFTPVKLVNHIKSDWYYLCKYQYTYETLEYSIAASEHHKYTDDIAAEICDLIMRLSETYDVQVRPRIAGVEMP